MPSFKKHLVLRGRNIGDLQGVPLNVAADQQVVQPNFMIANSQYRMDDATVAKFASIKDLMDRKSLILQAHSAGYRNDVPKTSWWKGDYALTGDAMASALEDAYTRVAHLLAEETALRAEKRKKPSARQMSIDAMGLAAWAKRANTYTPAYDEFNANFYFPGVQVLHLACCTGATPDWVTTFAMWVKTSRKNFGVAQTIRVAAPRDYVVYKPGKLTTQAFDKDTHLYEHMALKGYVAKNVDEVTIKDPIRKKNKVIETRTGVVDLRPLLTKGEAENLSTYNEQTDANKRLWALRKKGNNNPPWEDSLGRLRVCFEDPSPAVIKAEAAPKVGAAAVEGLAVVAAAAEVPAVAAAVLAPAMAAAPVAVAAQV